MTTSKLSKELREHEKRTETMLVVRNILKEALLKSEEIPDTMALGAGASTLGLMNAIGQAMNQIDIMLPIITSHKQHCLSEMKRAK